MMGSRKANTINIDDQGEHATKLKLHKSRKEEDPLNIENTEIEKSSLQKEKVEPKIQGHLPKNAKDPLGITKIDKTKKRKPENNEQETNHKKTKVSGVPASSISNNSIQEKPPSSSNNTSSNNLNAEVISNPTTQEEAPNQPSAAELKKQKKEALNRKFRYGNFDKYYGTRLSPGEKDSRLALLPKEWFYKRNVLDIGCNVGYLTLSIAHDYEPKKILGIDIDSHLIGVARKNIRHYCDKSTEFCGKFPASFSKFYGPISQTSSSFSIKFPDNVWFMTHDYVSFNASSSIFTQQHNVILALSITKWIHLNWGDAGIERLFIRAFNELLPGGIFILEPQEIGSYNKRAKTLPELWQNFTQIKLLPLDFRNFLLGQVGFERMEEIGVPDAKNKGFARRIEVYFKPGSFRQPAEQ